MNSKRCRHPRSLAPRQQLSPQHSALHTVAAPPSRPAQQPPAPSNGVAPTRFNERWLGLAAPRHPMLAVRRSPTTPHRHQWRTPHNHIQRSRLALSSESIGSSVDRRPLLCLRQGNLKHMNARRNPISMKLDAHSFKPVAEPGVFKPMARGAPAASLSLSRRVVLQYTNHGTCVVTFGAAGVAF